MYIHIYIYIYILIKYGSKAQKEQLKKQTSLDSQPMRSLLSRVRAALAARVREYWSFN